MFNILQEGGIDDHAEIAAGDKDFPIFWKRALKMATVWMFEYAAEHGGIDNQFKDQADKLIETIEFDDDYDSLMGQFLDPLFGSTSKTDFKTWKTNLLKEEPWIFDAAQIRQKVFEFASIEYNV